MHPGAPHARRLPLHRAARSIGEAIALGSGHESDWLYWQSQRIARALATGEIALAQIYGLRMPLRDLDGPALRRLAAAARLIKADFDPDEPRITGGEPGAGEWTDEGDADEPAPPSGSGGGGKLPPEADGDERGAESGDDSPPIEYTFSIPAERPDTPQARNSIVRRTAEWLRQAAALGAAFAPDTRVKAVLSVIEATAWIVEYWPQIQSYLDAPKSFEELQNAVNDPQPGYQTHHIVERQYGSTDPSANWRRFEDRLDTAENLVRIPFWKHVEISSWYSSNNAEFGGQSPRSYLRGKSWDEQYEVGLRALRDAGVLE